MPRAGGSEGFAQRGFASDAERSVRRLWLALTAWLLLAAVLIGGAPRPAAIGLGMGAAVLVALVARVPQAVGSGFVLLLTALAAWTLLTVVPAPCGWVRLIAPVAEGIWRDGMLPLRTAPPAGCSLSVAPVATWQSALNLCSCGVVAAGSGVVARRLGLSAVLLSLVASASVVAVITLVHALFRIEYLFGISSLPASTASGSVSVLVNPNNLAGYMNVGAFAALGLLGSRRPPVPRGLLTVAGVLAVATSIWSGSRGGVLALGFGLVGWGLLLVVRRFSSSDVARSEATRQAPFFALLVLAGGSMAALGASPRLEHELLGDDVGKIEQLGQLAASLGRVDPTGIGRGAFDSMSARLTAEGRNFTHEFVENFALSWLFEWGPWVGGAALLVLLWLMAPGRLKPWGHPSAEGAWLAVWVLLLQNLADLGLELPAVLGACAAVGGGLEGSRDARDGGATHKPVPASRTENGSQLRSGRIAWASLAGLLSIALVGTALTGPTLAVLRAQTRGLAEAALATEATEQQRKVADGAVASGLRRFPAEPYFVIVGGWLALGRGTDAMPWAAEALRRAPRSARAHALVAEVLVRRGAPEQALLHVARAAEADPALLPALTDRLVRLRLAPELLERAAPRGAPGARWLLELWAKLPPDTSAGARRHLLLAAETRAPRDPRVQAALGWALMGDLERGSRPCPPASEEATCRPEADTQGRVRRLAQGLEGTPTCEGLRLRAALLAYEGRGPEAVGALAACPGCAAPEQCARDRVHMALEHGTEDERRQALGAFRATTCDSPSRCADAEAWLSSVFARRAKPELALVHALRAAELDPVASRYFALARAARAAGRPERALAALDRARRLGGSDSELEGWAASTRSRNAEALDP